MVLYSLSQNALGVKPNWCAIGDSIIRHLYLKHKVVLFRHTVYIIQWKNINFFILFLKLIGSFALSIFISTESILIIDNILNTIIEKKLIKQTKVNFLYRITFNYRIINLPQMML